MSNPIQTGLQKELFLESMSLIHEPGWEVLKEADLIAFKASVAVPFMNFCLWKRHPSSIQESKRVLSQKAVFLAALRDPRRTALARLGIY